MKIYKILIHYYLHFYILTFFEVIFYEFYIYPYENQLIYNFINYKINSIIKMEGGYNKLKKEYPDIHNYIESLFLNCNNNSINKYNKKLFELCHIYLILSSIIFLFFIMYDVYIFFSIVKQNDNNTNIVLSPINENNMCDIELTLINFKVSPKNIVNGTDKNNTSIYTYFKTSIFFYELRKTIIFIILISFFEYTFFTFIICKLKPIDLTYILCDTVKRIL